MDYDSPSQQIDTEIVKTHFPRDFNNKIVSFVGYLKKNLDIFGQILIKNDHKN